jgi:hypothetical protein
VLFRSRILATAAEAEWAIADHGTEATAGSVGLACALAYTDFRHPDIGWHKQSPRLAAFASKFAARPSMKAWPLK